MGKPMGNGMPVAGDGGPGRCARAVRRRCPYFNTFGGNPVSIAAAPAVLDVIEDEDLIANAATVGGALRAELAAIDDPRLGDVRGAGLYIGVEVVTDRRGTRPRGRPWIVNALRERRVLISVCGRDGNVLKSGRRWCSRCPTSTGFAARSQTR